MLNDAMAGKEKGGEEVKAPGHHPALPLRDVSQDHTGLVSFNEKTQRILRWVREALRCHIIEFVKINLTMSLGLRMAPSVNS